MGTSGGVHAHRFFLHSQRTERNQHADGRTAGREPEHERCAAEIDQIPGDETAQQRTERDGENCADGLALYPVGRGDRFIGKID